MPKRGLEPPRAYAHGALNAARLPIPPLRQGRKPSPRATLASSGRWTAHRRLAYHLRNLRPVAAKQTPSASPDQTRTLARNPKATHDYHVLETFEAGIVLTGTEV